MVEAVSDVIRLLPGLSDKVVIQPSPFPLPNTNYPVILVTYGDEDFAGAVEEKYGPRETFENQMFVSVQVNVWLVIDRKNLVANKAHDFIFKYRQMIRQVLYRPDIIDICRDCEIDLNPPFDEKKIPDGIFVSAMSFYYKILSDRIDGGLIGISP